MPNPELINAINDALASRILAVWPDTTPTDAGDKTTDFGIWFAEDIGSIAFTRLKPPYVVVHVGEWEKSKDFSGLDNSSHEADFMIYYVRAANQTNRTIRRRVQELERYLSRPENCISESVDGGQILSIEAVSYNRYLPINREFMDRNLPHRGAAVAVRVLKWEEPS